MKNLSIFWNVRKEFDFQHCCDKLMEKEDMPDISLIYSEPVIINGKELASASFGLQIQIQ